RATARRPASRAARRACGTRAETKPLRAATPGWRAREPGETRRYSVRTDLISALMLGAVEPLVDLRNQVFLGVRGAGTERGYPRTHRHARRAPTDPHLRVLHGDAHALGDSRRAALRNAAQQHQELLAAVAGQDIFGAQLVRDHFGDATQHDVTRV